ncbi:family 10 glycosylhydrolase [Paraclostridium sordellii]|uniref:Cell surface protein n=1 Tax=Paraclostridium sordellii TaxID=1505 RepID=A0A0C7IB84_PARSO|nr:family 10 glycosylhydrolase [Paeniclostridium sordellii]CEN79735.1 cell surface protein [[Clostridium] sordellii] [Paeniclostridium sordellii]CEO12192.1 cell surface protein [[Clostridium] sordellii] [Paeniclostridium sordellii]CEP87782.1 cell surface protein [[Clostridium] sordellii] [Paeniclostridium sordellii]CEP97482.1 cell surface protein [[Clostridium] sordellii] [Paeniclostridium sordellii]CEQ01170.1 cell surface protein [[Clostridium] sordellii] [Paeniclostridium sordellii]
MKKFFIISFICFLCFFNKVDSIYANENYVNAAWITTVYNSDWPKNKNNIFEQKKQMVDILDNLKDAGINTVMFQARPKGDALYSSQINPWSDVLTGKQGINPGYDPLRFVIDEAHKRGMKVHAWLNPYRVTTSGTNLDVLSDNNPAKQHPQWTIVHDERIYLNPELNEVKQLIYRTVDEIVTNYNVDGIHFDDYFYPSNYPLPSGQGRDGEVANQRRNHINEMIAGVKNTIKQVNPNVKFGVSPSGIWKNKESDVNGSDTRGKESYYSDYADTVNWIKNKYIDYIVPQVYWQIGYNIADYSKLTKWWSDKVKNSGVDLYIGQGIYKDEVANEIDQQLELNKQHSQIKGSVFYSTSDIILNRKGCRDKIKNFAKENEGFEDINGNWAEEDIKKFIKLGYVNGYEDNTFRPDDTITRAEFVKLVNRVFNLKNKVDENFTDVYRWDWYYDEIRVALNSGYINGYEDGSFKPNNMITRQEAMKIITSLKNTKDLNLDKIFLFNDYMQIEEWAKPYVEGAIESGYIKGDENNNINPQNKLTRAEAVTMLNRIR